MDKNDDYVRDIISIALRAVYDVIAIQEHSLAMYSRHLNMQAEV